MIIIGIDAHKMTHTLVAVDSNGRKLAEKTVEATDSGHATALRWARRRFKDEQLMFAIEDVRMVSGRLERFLLTSNAQIVRVPTRLMARTRHQTARSRGKSDPIDALAAARAALREPNLPVASHDEQSRELKLLVDRRSTLVDIRTATSNRLTWRIHELDPERSPGPLNVAKNRAPLRAWLSETPGIVAEIACEEIDDIERLTTVIDRLERRIQRRVGEIAPNLMGIPGVGGLTAAKIIGETALVTRFGGSEASFARYAGVAPTPQWSGSTAGRMRRSRDGNRALNSAIHRIAVTQLRLGGPGRAYVDRRIEEGNSKTEALRSLKRKITRVVFTRLNADHRLRHRHADPVQTQEQRV